VGPKGSTSARPFRYGASWIERKGSRQAKREMNRSTIWEGYGGSGIPSALQLFREIEMRREYDPQYFTLAGWLGVLREAAADPEATSRERIRIKRILVDLLRAERNE